MRPPLRYAKTVDGGNVAYVDTGAGYPVITFHIAPFKNLALEWDIPLFAEFYQAMAERFRYIRFEPRGMANSDAAPPGRPTMDYLADDVDAVAAAAGLKQFAILAGGQFVPFGIRYAADRPDIVTHLMLYNAVIRDVPAWTSEQHIKLANETKQLRAASLGVDFTTLEARSRLGRLATDEAVAAMVRAGYSNRSAKWKDCWYRVLEMWREMDIREDALRVRQPAFIASFGPAYDGSARELAAALPGAWLALGVFDLENNLASEANGRATIASEAARFLYGDADTPLADALGGAAARVTPREFEILALMAAGHSNAEIADSLVLSAGTVARHVSNMYGKLGIHNRVQATAVYYGLAGERPTS